MARNYGYENIIMKPFTIDGKGTWSDATYRSKGVLRIFPDSMELEVKMMSGCDPDVTDLVNFILGDKDVRTMIHMYQKKGRKDLYAINMTSGMSGRVDVYINFYDEYGLEVKGKHLMHISCYDKVPGVKRMYIGDFVELVYAYRIERRKSTGKYVKPYFAPEEVSTEIHKII